MIMETVPTLSILAATNFKNTNRCQVYYNYRFINQYEDYIWKTFEFRFDDLFRTFRATNRWIVNGKYTLDLEKRLTRLHCCLGNEVHL